MAKAVSSAVSSVLSKLPSNADQNSSDSSSEDFQTRPRPPLPPQNKKKSGKKRARTGNLPKLPSTFLTKRETAFKRGPTKGKHKLLTYDRDIICLPKSCGKSGGNISIPRSRDKLAKSGLIGKIRLKSDMTQDDIYDEIRSVFRGPMKGDCTFPFDVLQPTGGRSKTLTIPALSSSFKWTASAIVPKNAKSPLYILAKESLQLALEMDKTSDDESDLGNESDDLPLVDLTKSDDLEIENDCGISRMRSQIQPACSRSITGACDNQPKDHEDKCTDSYSAYENVMDDPSWSTSPTPPPLSPCTPRLDGSELPVSDLLKMHRVEYLPNDKEDRVRITVRRKHLLEDCLHKMRNGLDVTKYLRVVFVGEPAVDDGGPLRELLYLLIQSLSNNNMLFCGPPTSRVPRHNVVELDNRTYYYVGVIIALSLIHGGPAPQFFSAAVADYIVYGVQMVKAKISDVPEMEIRKKIQKIQDVTSDYQLQELLNSGDYDFRYDLGIAQPAQKMRKVDCEKVVV